MPNLSDYRVSVIIPCYKHAQFVAEAVESIIAQTLPVLEVIVVNDGSPDNTREVVNQLIRRYPRYRVSCVDKPNGGLADARNAGIQRAEGEWILPLDADDRLDHTFVEKGIKALKDDPSRNMAFANQSNFGASTEQLRPEDYSLERLACYNLFPYASIFPKEMWWRSGGYDRSLPWAGEDYSFWISCGEIGLTPARIDEYLFKYRVHKEGSMYTELMKRWPVVEAMIRTTHPNIYSGPALLSAHSIIGQMGEDTLSKLEEKIVRFDELAHPYLWRGMRNEARGFFEAALADYHMYRRLHYKPDWQPIWRSLICNLTLGRWEIAQRDRVELAELFPNQTWVSSLLAGISTEQNEYKFQEAQ